MSIDNHAVRAALGAVLKWIMGVAGVVLTAAIIWLFTAFARRGEQIVQLFERQQTMDVAVQMNKEAREKADRRFEQWIDDWYNELKVPERDQRQDNGIEYLNQHLEELIARLLVLERAR